MSDKSSFIQIPMTQEDQDILFKRLRKGSKRREIAVLMREFDRNEFINMKSRLLFMLRLECWRGWADYVADVGLG